MQKLITVCVLIVLGVPAAAAHVSGGKVARACPTHARVGNARTSYVAIVRRHATAYRSPGRHAFAHFGRKNINHVRTVFAIRSVVYRRGCRPAWFRVQLPVRPNGVVGYVPARSVLVGKVHTRIAVDLSARRLTFFKRGRTRLTTRVSIGSQGTPTPVGHFYVNQELIAPDPSGPWGPAGIGVSAFSPVLTHWVQGGPIAVHGTNRPDMIGQAVSTGCIRVRNATVMRLLRMTPPGTPVDIVR